MGWGLGAAWVIVAGSLLLVLGTAAQAWASLTAARHLLSPRHRSPAVKRAAESVLPAGLASYAMSTGPEPLGFALATFALSLIAALVVIPVRVNRLRKARRGEADHIRETGDGDDAHLDEVHYVSGVLTKAGA